MREPKRPRQASLRRAVSSAYYALFHLLTEEASRITAQGRPTGLRARVQRAFAHSDMKAVCQQFSHGRLDKPTSHLISPPLQNEIASVAAAFVSLQEMRYQADYDTSTVFNRIDVLQKIEMARQAFDDWHSVRRQPNASVFLTALLLQRYWGKS